MDKTLIATSVAAALGLVGTITFGVLNHKNKESAEWNAFASDTRCEFIKSQGYQDPVHNLLRQTKAYQEKLNALKAKDTKDEEQDVEGGEEADDKIQKLLEKRAQALTEDEVISLGLEIK